MGISNVSSNLRPGICTSSTRPTTPYEGQVIYETDTNRTLVWDNASWIGLAQSGDGGLVRIIPTSGGGTGAAVSSTGKVTITGGTAISANGCFSSAFTSYKVVVSNAKLNTAVGFSIRLRSSTTDSSANYYSAGYGIAYGAAVGGPYTERVDNGSGWQAAVGSTNLCGFSFEVFNPFLAERTTYSTLRTDSRTDGAALFYAGFHNASTSYDGITVYIGTGAFTSCSLMVYGYNE
jgi:hypothetical protein